MDFVNHELYDLNELIMSCVNTITSMAYMIDHVQDPTLKKILERQFPYHIRDYNMKVEFINQKKGATKELPIFKIDGNFTNYMSQINNQVLTVQPRITVSDMNDREMATSYLLTLKRAGREYAWAVMETADPELRGFLETAFLMSSAHAYEVWQYMVEKGFYPLQPAIKTDVTRLGDMYEVIPENQPRITEYINKYQTETEGTSQNMYQQ